MEVVEWLQVISGVATAVGGGIAGKFYGERKSKRDHAENLLSQQNELIDDFRKDVKELKAEIYQLKEEHQGCERRCDALQKEIQILKNK